MFDNKMRLSIAAGLAVGVLWLFCSLFVWVAPVLSAKFMGYMIHMEAEIVWQLEPGGVLVGGILWILMSFVLVYLSLFTSEVMKQPGSEE